jgi:hypothetical protein
MSKKVLVTEQNKNSVPVFRLKPMSDERVTCKYIGYVENADKLTDQPIEFDEVNKATGSKTIIGLGKCGDYLVYGKASICNISGGYLIKNKKLPVYYMIVLYNKKFVSGGLFSIFLYFTIDDTTMDTLTEPNKYVNRVLTGKYTMELVTDEGFLGELIEKRTPLIEQELMEKYVDEFTDNESDNDRLMEKIRNEVNEKLDQYRKLFEPIEIKTTNLKSIIKKMRELIISDIYKDLIVEGLRCREEERKDKNCPDMDYKPPDTKKVINLKELKANPEKIDDIINRLSDVDSDED